ncbi:YaaC family protein, partial [Bacillus subtilis]|uniref:YaaC family protein n=1 Tax=Bacillus subtilis TaxID=1423 RepID=UPI001BDBA0C5
PQSFYKQPPYSPLQIKPILLFYPIPHLIKPSLITPHPHYPTHTSLLPHALTTTKPNKQNYSFTHHQLKIQPNPLSLHFIKHLFPQSHILHEPYTIKKLLIP